MKSVLNIFFKIFSPPLCSCYFKNSNLRRWSRLILSLSILITVPIVNANTNNEEPISYIGHGAFFDNKEKQIVPTFEFIAKSQDWYQKKLSQKLSDEKAYEFERFEQKINNLNSYGQSRLIARQYALDWLIANTLKPKEETRMQGKIHALRMALNLELPQSNKLTQLHQRREFKLDQMSAKRLNHLKVTQIKVTQINEPAAFATTNQGQDYIDECSLAGVPIPPTIGSAMWQSQGFIPTGEQFIVGTPAEVRTYQSFAPDGMCIALPRYTNNALTTVQLDGVICLGEATSNVCIWDNQMSGNGFSFPAGTMIPIGEPDLAINPAGQYMAGGFELNGGTGGICTDCHAGENPYIIHPDAMLSVSLDMGDLGSAPLNLPMFAANRYDPHVAAAWPQNQLSMAQPLVPGACVGCHVQGGSGGRFPHLSTELPGYCGTVLAQAITDTMPPFNPGSAAADPAVIDFQNDWCSSPVSAGPSNRGDPHLTTTNGVNYDFQSDGEFTALRNSASGFELQTRQSGVETTFTPGANP